MFRDAAKASPRPLVLLTVLPESPAHLLADQRLLYESAYANGGPSEAPFTEVQLQVLSAGTRCRAIKRPLALAPPGAPTPLQLGTLQVPSTPGVVDIMAWGTAMVKQMSDMQAAIAMLQANCSQISPGAPARLPLPAPAALPASSTPPRTAMPSAATPSPSPAISPLVQTVTPQSPSGFVELPTVHMTKESPPREVGAPTPVVSQILAAVEPPKKRKVEPQRKSVADATEEILRSLSAKAPAGADGDDSCGQEAGSGGKGRKDQGCQGKKGGKVDKGGQGGKVKKGGEGSKGGGTAVCLLNHESSRAQFIVRFGAAAPSKIFRYDKGSEKSVKTAWNQAKRFARSQCVELGLKVPERVL